MLKKCSEYLGAKMFRSAQQKMQWKALMHAFLFRGAFLPGEELRDINFLAVIQLMTIMRWLATQAVTKCYNLASETSMKLDIRFKFSTDMCCNTLGFLGSYGIDDHNGVVDHSGCNRILQFSQ